MSSLSKDLKLRVMISKKLKLKINLNLKSIRMIVVQAMMMKMRRNIIKERKISKESLNALGSLNNNG